MSTYFKNDTQEVLDASGGGITKLFSYLHAINDKVQFYKNERWMLVIVLAVFFLIRLILTGGKAIKFIIGYHAVAYCLGIHLLNAFIGFISPLEDPEEDVEVDNGSFLPQK
jgi:hypothetical protein